MTRLETTLGAVALLLATLVAGCGGGGGGGGESCGRVQPCGGDIKGNWTVIDSCINSGALSSQFLPIVTTLCPSAKIKSADLTSTGSFLFNADMTYVADATTTGTVQLDVPQSCVMGLSCALVTLTIQFQLAQSPVPAVQAVTCAGNADCVCSVTLNPLRIGGAGNYSTNGTLVTTVPTTAAGMSESREYCVQGGRLHFVTVDRTSPTAAGQGPITADLVSRKD